MREVNTLTCRKGGWYQISYYLHHPSLNISGTDSQDSLGTFTIGILFTCIVTDAITGISSTLKHIEYTNQEISRNPSTCNYIATVLLIPGNTFEFVFSTTSGWGSSTDEDYLVRISVMKL